MLLPPPLLPGPLRLDPVFMLLLLLGRRRLRSLRRIFRFRRRLATDMRDEAAGANRGKGVSWRLILEHVLWQGEGRRVRGKAEAGRARRCSKTSKAEKSSAKVSGGLAGTVAPNSSQRLVRSRRSKASRTSTMPKGVLWKTSMVPRVSVISIFDV